MKIFTILLQLWSVLSPYLTRDNIAAVEKAIEQAIVDFKGGNLAQVLVDLANALNDLVPQATDKINAVCRQ